MRAAKPWFRGDDNTVATVNGRRYRLVMGGEAGRPEGRLLAGRFLETVRRASTAKT